MKSLRKNLEPDAGFGHAPVTDGAEPAAAAQMPQPLAPARWDWDKVQRVLVVRLRSIGDTVLATPALRALRRFLPEAQVDVLLENWVAPLLEGFPDVDNIITVERRSSLARARVAKLLRAARYDVVYNLHGGSTSTFLTRATGAPERVGFAEYRYSGLYNHLAPSPVGLWGREKLHSVEQQLALVGWTGVPVSDLPPTRLAVTKEASASVSARLRAAGFDDGARLALIHPAAAFETKRWEAANFARLAEWLQGLGLAPVAVVAPGEELVAEALNRHATIPVVTFKDLALPEVTALAKRARLFVGNDSGIAHIAAAVECPAVVIFGSSNVTHWRPWAVAPSAIVREELACQPCPGYACAEYDEPECIRRVSLESVARAVREVLEASQRSRQT